jgi:hypothetical protein
MRGEQVGGGRRGTRAVDEHDDAVATLRHERHVRAVAFEAAEAVHERVGAVGAEVPAEAPAVAVERTELPVLRDVHALRLADRRFGQHARAFDHTPAQVGGEVAPQVARGREMRAGRVHVGVVLEQLDAPPAIDRGDVRQGDEGALERRQPRAGRAHADGLDDEPLHDVLPRLVVHGLEDHADQVVAEVVVGKRAELPVRRVKAQQIEQLRARELTGESGAHHDRPVAIQSVRQREQVPQRDRVAFDARREACRRQVARHGRVEVEVAALCRNDGRERGERLRGRGDVERRVAGRAAAARQIRDPEAVGVDHPVARGDGDAHARRDARVDEGARGGGDVVAPAVDAASLRSGLAWREIENGNEQRGEQCGASVHGSSGGSVGFRLPAVAAPIHLRVAATPGFRNARRYGASSRQAPSGASHSGHCIATKRTHSSSSAAVTTGWVADSRNTSPHSSATKTRCASLASTPSGSCARENRSRPATGRSLPDRITDPPHASISSTMPARSAR